MDELGPWTDPGVPMAVVPAISIELSETTIPHDVTSNILRPNSCSPIVCKWLSSVLDLRFRISTFIFLLRISYYLLEPWIICPQPWPWFYCYSTHKVTLPHLAVSIGLFPYQLPISPCPQGSYNSNRRSSLKGPGWKGLPQIFAAKG